MAERRNGRPEIMIACRDLSKWFELGEQVVHALDGVSVQIPSGQFVAIMGPSGSGKSTLLYMLGGLDRPTNGDILVSEQPTSQLGGEDLAAFRSRTIGFIFQAFHLLAKLIDFIKACRSTGCRRQIQSFFGLFTLASR